MKHCDKPQRGRMAAHARAERALLRKRKHPRYWEALAHAFAHPELWQGGATRAETPGATLMQRADRGLDAEIDGSARVTGATVTSEAMSGKLPQDPEALLCAVVLAQKTIASAGNTPETPGHLLADLAKRAEPYIQRALEDIRRQPPEAQADWLLDLFRTWGDFDPYAEQLELARTLRAGADAAVDMARGLRLERGAVEVGALALQTRAHDIRARAEPKLNAALEALPERRADDGVAQAAREAARAACGDLGGDLGGGAGAGAYDALTVQLEVLAQHAQDLADSRKQHEPDTRVPALLALAIRLGRSDAELASAARRLRVELCNAKWSGDAYDPETQKNLRRALNRRRREQQGYEPPEG